MFSRLILYINFMILSVVSSAQSECDTMGYDQRINGISYYDGIMNLLVSGDSASKDHWPKSVSKIKQFQILNATYYPYRNQYLLTAGVEGSGDSYYEVGYRNSIFKQQFHILNNENKKFVTNNGICLGISEEIFRDKLRFAYSRFTLIRPNVKIGNSVYIIYYISCRENPATNQHHSVWANINSYPDYTARYIFRDGKLVKFSFGYIPYHPTLEFEDIIY